MAALSEESDDSALGSEEWGGWSGAAGGASGQAESSPLPRRRRRPDRWEQPLPYGLPADESFCRAGRILERERGGREEPEGLGRSDEEGELEAPKSRRGRGRGRGRPSPEPASKRPRQLFGGEEAAADERPASAKRRAREAAEARRKEYSDLLADAADEEELAAELDGEAEGGPTTEVSAPRKRRQRNKKTDEGDWLELKPRHLRGKRKGEAVARMAHNVAMSDARKAAAAHAPPLETDPSAEVVLRDTLRRLLRPKLRRWCVYEWFISPVDEGWYRENEFVKMLGACGLGQVTALTRAEWSCVRLLLGRARRFSPAFIAQERARLAAHRDEVRASRRRHAALGALLDEYERLDSLANTQLAVGQRVSALHPRLSYLHTGTILTPDGDNYRVQFDNPALGVQVVQDFFVAPLLDGSRNGEYLTRGGAPAGATDSPADAMDSPADADLSKLMVEAAGAGVPEPPKASETELQLLAYLLRLLKRKRLLISETRRVCRDAEDALRASGYVLHENGVPAEGIVVAEDALGPKVEVTAAQQRQLGQVPPPPLLPLMHILLKHWEAMDPAVAAALVKSAARWTQEISWLQEELRGTSRRVDEAMSAMRPMSQRFSLALGTAAPEPISVGFGVSVCSQMRAHSETAALAILSRVLAESEPDGVAPQLPMRAAREQITSALELLLQIQAWAVAPVDSAIECRFAITAALNDLIPSSGSDEARKEFSGVLSAAQALQVVLAAGCS